MFNINKSSDIDLLERQEFVDNVINVVDILAEGKRNACYAINGGWGTGKTYVLNRLETQLELKKSEDTTLDKYLVIHYNCWEYDYYEEPLIAIVAVILDQLDKKVNVVSRDNVEVIKGMLKAIGLSLWEKTASKIKEITGIDPKDLQEIVSKANETRLKEINSNHEFDSYFNFKQVLEKLSETICKLSKDQTIIFVVDELDRCLPEYAIKVLERLHHIFGSVSNLQVILSMDKRQLENTIKQLFGENISIKKYLDKFIDFEINLTVGEINKEAAKVYKPYYDCFCYNVTSKEETEEFCNMILKGIDIRVLKQIYEKSFLCHQLLFSTDDVCDASVLCIELFLMLLKEFGLKVEEAKRNFNIDRLFVSNKLFSSKDEILTGLTILSGIFSGKNSKRPYRYLRQDNFGTNIFVKDIYGLILACYRKILGFEGDEWFQTNYTGLSINNMNLYDFTLKYWKLIKTVN